MLIYLHIPRTGGSSLHEMLKKMFDYRFTRPTAEQVVKLNQPARGLDVMHSHFPFGIHHYIPDTPYEYATILRHPVDRRISGFFSGKTTDQTTSDFIEYYRAGKSRGHDNVSAKLIAGGNREAVGKGYYHIVEQASTQELFSRAKDNLSTFAFVGDFANYEEELRKMQNQFRWPAFPQNKIIRENFSSTRPKAEEIPADVWDIICKLDALDLRLYEEQFGC